MITIGVVDKRHVVERKIEGKVVAESLTFSQPKEAEEYVEKRLKKYEGRDIKEVYTNTYRIL